MVRHPVPVTNQSLRSSLPKVRSVEVRQPHEFRFGSEARGGQCHRGGGSRRSSDRLRSYPADAGAIKLSGWRFEAFRHGLAGTSGIERGKAEASVSAIAGNDVDGQIGVESPDLSFPSCNVVCGRFVDHALGDAEQGSRGFRILFASHRFLPIAIRSGRFAHAYVAGHERGRNLRQGHNTRRRGPKPIAGTVHGS